MDKEFLLDPCNMPGLDACLEVLNDKSTSHPNCPNHSGDLTIKGFCDAANALIEPFGKALNKVRETNSAN